MSAVLSHDRRSGTVAPTLDRLGREGHAGGALGERRDGRVAAAEAETAPGPHRLDGELTRTRVQLRLSARG